MQKFETLCVDKETEMEMIAGCCSFKEVCKFLDEENANGKFGNLVGVKGMLNSTYDKTEIKFEKASFLYDKERGLLLKSK